MKAPAGWKVRQHYRGKTLVFEDPLVHSQKGVEYTRNITVALRNEVRPIDALESQRLSQRLIQELSASVSEFEINESRVIDYRGKGDAILVFTSFKQGKTPMRQMHVFTSGSSNSVLLTYTDFRETFDAEGGLDKAWMSMMSAEVKGDAPKRYDGVFYAASSLAFMATGAYLSKQLRRKQLKAELRQEEESLFDDDDDFELQRPAGKEPWPFAETELAGRIA
ncbi:MAG: hypothetical protein EOP07_05395 [Proteobacteria bacterium]|nr:MAG: hypothetical protein EOP07_05395 [Pseudomonadota bacterium]